jgi:hypothetical protein
MGTQFRTKDLTTYLSLDTISPVRQLVRYYRSLVFLLGPLLVLLLFSGYVCPEYGYGAQVKLAWDPNVEPEVAGYKVYVGEASGAYSRAIDVGNAAECTVPDLEDGKTYYFSVTAYSVAGEESGFAAEASYNVPGDAGGGSGDAPGAAGGGSGGGNCFIATAAFGSPLAPEVMVLRRFRDRHLLTNTVGRAFVGVYYASSPPIAEFIRAHQTARAIVRSWISFAIFLVKYPSWTLCAMLLLVATLVSMGRARGRAGGVIARPPTSRADSSPC